MSERARTVCRRVRPIAVAVVALTLGASGCLERREQDRPGAGSGTECTACHGDPARAGTALRRAAPPVDTLGETDPRAPGVGAHSIHLDATATHGPVACDECHVVPEHTDSAGHLDHPLPARIAFGALAKQGGLAPSYDPRARTCGDTYCHGHAGAVWTEARSADRACGTCHGLPPKPPHPASDRCSACHGSVLDENRHFVRPDLHVNGTVDLAPAPCDTCHGGGGDPAPPADTRGNVQVSAIGVGAHRAHLAGGASSRPLECGECHTVPARAEDAGHILEQPARVVFTGVGAGHDRSPVWDRGTATCAGTWCHGPSGTGTTSPPWTTPGPLSCKTCHGEPPPAPHPQLTDCSLCHGAVVAEDDATILDRSLHVNGVVDVSVPASCTACHGRGTDPAPVPGQPGAGAHRAHLSPTGPARPVPCAECHRVPGAVLDAGHLDSARPAELTFSGAAAAGSAPPTIDNGTCRNMYCHGASFADGDPSGGSATTPSWDATDGSARACGACHSLPPPAPHPYASLNPKCSACHEDISDDNVTFTHPERHIDGEVTFAVP